MVNLRLDAVGFQMGLERIATWGTDRVGVVHIAITRSLAREFDNACQEFIVPRCYLTPALDDLRYAGQALKQDGCLQCVDAPVETWLDAFFTVDAAVVSETYEPVAQFLTVRHDPPR